MNPGIRRVRRPGARSVVASSNPAAYGDGLFGNHARASAASRCGRHPGAVARWARAARHHVPEVDSSKRKGPGVRQAMSMAGVLKLLLTRGDGGRGYAPRSMRLPAWHCPGIRCRRRCRARCGCTTARPGWRSSGLAGLKHCNRLEQVLARAPSRHAGCDEGLMRDMEGARFATAANLLVLQGGRWTTPPFRAAGWRACCAAGCWTPASVEGAGRGRTLDDADALALCNAVRGILPVASLGARRWSADGRWTGSRNGWRWHSRCFPGRARTHAGARDAMPTGGRTLRRFVLLVVVVALLAVAWIMQRQRSFADGRWTGSRPGRGLVVARIRWTRCCANARRQRRHRRAPAVAVAGARAGCGRSPAGRQYALDAGTTRVRCWCTMRDGRSCGATSPSSRLEHPRPASRPGQGARIAAAGGRAGRCRADAMPWASPGSTRGASARRPMPGSAATDLDVLRRAHGDGEGAGRGVGGAARRTCRCARPTKR